MAKKIASSDVNHQHSKYSFMRKVKEGFVLVTEPFDDKTRLPCNNLLYNIA